MQTVQRLAVASCLLAAATCLFGAAWAHDTAGGPLTRVLTTHPGIVEPGSCLVEVHNCRKRHKRTWYELHTRVSGCLKAYTSGAIGVDNASVIVVPWEGRARWSATGACVLTVFDNGSEPH